MESLHLELGQQCLEVLLLEVPGTPLVPRGFVVDECQLKKCKRRDCPIATGPSHVFNAMTHEVRIA
jgi:hypothetical protein